VITDSVKTARGKAYKTSGGRKVYGGGGITPDIFVPFDTTGFSINMLPLFANQQFNNFIYRYYLQNRASLDSFKNAKDFTDRFHANVMTWKSLMDFVAENKIQLPVIPEKDKVEIEKRIKSYLGRQIWGMEGFYEVSNSWDLTVQKALQAN
jgi:carboxyl-terminal processing protease